jgi:hypothetical protein
MRYVLLISNDERAAIGSQERSRREAAFGCFEDQMRVRGTSVVGDRIQPSESATTVRCWEGGDVIISAGSNPLATEQLTGVFVVDCDDLDEAIRVATAVPAAWYGTVEVRPTRAEEPAYVPELTSVVDSRAV